jgi:hypothetical protein
MRSERNCGILPAEVKMAAQERFARINRGSVYLAWCGLAGLILSLIVSFTIGRWGSGELVILTFGPIFAALILRTVSWVPAGIV